MTWFIQVVKNKFDFIKHVLLFQKDGDLFYGANV